MVTRQLAFGMAYNKAINFSPSGSDLQNATRFSGPLLRRYMRKQLTIVFLFTVILTGCNVDPKLGYEGITLGDESSTRKLVAKLEEGNFDFYTYEENGSLWIAYRESDEPLIHKLVSEHFRNLEPDPILDDWRYCTSNSEQAERFVSKLKAAEITSKLQEEANERCPICYCIYVPREHAVRAQELNEDYQQMRQVIEAQQTKEME